FKPSYVKEKRPVRSLTAKQAPHRPGTAPALGLRAGSDVYPLYRRPDPFRRSKVMKSFLSRWFGAAPRTPRRPLRRQLRFEELESRTVPSVTAHFVGSQLIADGDTSGNTIRVDVVGSGEFALQRISYLAGGSYVEVGRYGGFSSLVINSGAGNDTVRIDAVLYPGSAITINGNSGNDLVYLKPIPRPAPT